MQHIVPLLGFLTLTPCAAVYDQSRSELLPEAPLAMPSAATLPSFRSEQGVGPEAAMPMPAGNTLPSMLSTTGVGAEAPLPMPPAATLPSFLEHGASDSPQAGQGAGSTVTVPNGNGTTTIIHPDGSVEMVPTVK